MKSSKELREEIGRLSAEVQAFVAVAEDEGRDLTPEESQQVEAAVAKIGESGDKPTGLWAQVASTEKRERILAHATQPKASVEKPKQFAQPKSQGKLNAFASAQDAYDAGRWYQACFAKNPEVQQVAMQYCRDKGIGIQAAQTEASGGAGAYLVPDPVAAAVIQVRDKVGLARKLCRIVPMTADTLSLPKESTFQTVYYPSQAASITASDKAYAQVALSVVSRHTLTAIANELMADALVNVMDDVASSAAYKLALAEDDEFINGDGTSTYGGETGIITATGNGGKRTLASTKTAFSDITLADLSAVQALVAESYWVDDKMAWIMRRDTWVSVIEPLVFALGGNSSVTYSQGIPMPMLKGYPVHLTDRMPTSAAAKYGVFFGNFYDSVVIGDRMGITMASSSDAGFTINATYVRLSSRYDINVHAAAGASTEGGFAGILTAAS